MRKNVAIVGASIAGLLRIFNILPVLPENEFQGVILMAFAVTWILMKD